MTDDRHFIALSTSDLNKIEICSADVVRVVEEAYRALADGRSVNPRKLTVAPGDDHSVAYAMLGRDGARDVVAIKTSYKFDPEHDRDCKHYYTTLMLYDDTTGLPIAINLGNPLNGIGGIFEQYQRPVPFDLVADIQKTGALFLQLAPQLVFTDAQLACHFVDLQPPVGFIEQQASAHLLG